jgi:hypothetical protein
MILVACQTSVLCTALVADSIDWREYGVSSVRGEQGGQGLDVIGAPAGTHTPRPACLLWWVAPAAPEELGRRPLLLP